jgi:hypothetical protein
LIEQNNLQICLKAWYLHGMIFGKDGDCIAWYSKSMKDINPTKEVRREWNEHVKPSAASIRDVKEVIHGSFVTNNNTYSQGYALTGQLCTMFKSLERGCSMAIQPKSKRSRGTTSRRSS